MKTGIWMIVVALVSGPLHADEIGVLDRLVGRWQGEGSLSGLESQATLEFERVLGSRFLALRLRNTRKTADGDSVRFEGDAYYRIESTTSAPLTGRWFDSRGIQFPVTARIEADALVSDWGAEDIERGRTTYRLQGEALVVEDAVWRDGTLQVFGRLMYRPAGSED